MIVLDAFSGDAIPVHLLAKEAFACCLRVLKPDGILCVQLSNSYLELTSVVARSAKEFNMPTYLYANVTSMTHNESERCSDWMLITTNDEAISVIAAYGDLPEIVPTDWAPAKWTDSHCSTCELLK